MNGIGQTWYTLEYLADSKWIHIGTYTTWYSVHKEFVSCYDRAPNRRHRIVSHFTVTIR